MAKPKYPAELKIKIAKEYLSRDGSYRFLAVKYGVGKKPIEDCAKKHQAQEDLGFATRCGNRQYSSPFKTNCVKAVMRGEGSVDAIVAKYNISSGEVLRNWIKRYNANKELKDYDPKWEVYMADARRRTTQEERKEITEYCIAHGKDYKGTATLYDVSYSQVYN